MRKVILLALLFSAASHAAIQVEATRVVYSGAQHSASLAIKNIATQDYMVQTWLSPEKTNTSSHSTIPIVVVPPILKLAPQQSTSLRFIYSGKGLPNDKESMFWVNVQEIPPKSTQPNVLQIAIRTRIKLFYRPSDLHTTLNAEAKKLQFNIKGSTLTVTNSGPLHITFCGLSFSKEKGKVTKVQANMVDPFSKLPVLLPATIKGEQLVSYGYINDYGGCTVLPIKPL